MSPAMPTEHLDTDYLILGAGAMGMAFADVILAEDSRRASSWWTGTPARAATGTTPTHSQAAPARSVLRPQLHAAGAGGRRPDLGRRDRRLLQERDGPLLGHRSGAVPPDERARGDGRIVSTVDRDRVTTVTAHRRIVDGTYMQVNVPSVCPPRYTVDPDVTVVPPNGLTQVRRPRERYVVIGAGKTGTDSILFLLDQGVSPDRIQWIVPNDAWLWDRATVQPGSAAGDDRGPGAEHRRRHQHRWRLPAARTPGDPLPNDPQSLPTKWRCSTIDRRELAGLRQIDDVVRMGRVQRVGGGEIRLDRGTIPAVEDSLFIDCSAHGLPKLDPQPLFSEGHITLQSVFMCQQTFSAALIAHLELMDASDERRNRICAGRAAPGFEQDLPTTLLTTVQNMINCNRHIPLWLRRSRLYLAHHEPPHRYLLGSGKLVVL